VTGRNIQKDTKTHRARRVSVDKATGEILAEHWERYETSDVFSYSPTNDRPCNPSGVTHRYGRMCAGLGIESDRAADGGRGPADGSGPAGTRWRRRDHAPGL
jgi:hypothetical protein